MCVILDRVLGLQYSCGCHDRARGTLILVLDGRDLAGFDPVDWSVVGGDHLGQRIWVSFVECRCRPKPARSLVILTRSASKQIHKRVIWQVCETILLKESWFAFFVELVDYFPGFAVPVSVSFPFMGVFESPAAVLYELLILLIEDFAVFWIVSSSNGGKTKQC